MEVKDLEYYLNLDYDVSITRVETEGEISYVATARELDPLTFYGTGVTKSEALLSFEQSRHDLFPYYCENSLNIPVPTRVPTDMPSGRFLLRIDPVIHFKLTNLAKNSKKSLNSYIDQVLIEHVTSISILDNIGKYLIQQITTNVKKCNIVRVHATPFDDDAIRYSDYTSDAA